MILLREDPEALVVKYQPTVRAIVRNYVLSGLYRPSDCDDVIQEINAALLTKLGSIRRNYNGTSFLRTYLSAVIRNECLKIHRATASQPDPMPLQGHVADKGANPMARTVFQHDRAVFRVILDQYGGEKPKLLLMLKLYFRIPITADDVLRWNPYCGRRMLNSLLKSFGKPFDHLEDRMIYKLITPIVNDAETKSVSWDSLRKWMTSHIEEILVLLNGSPPTSTYDRETLRILVDDYFFPFLTRE